MYVFYVFVFYMYGLVQPDLPSLAFGLCHLVSPLPPRRDLPRIPGILLGQEVARVTNRTVLDDPEWNAISLRVGTL